MLNGLLEMFYWRWMHAASNQLGTSTVSTYNKQGNYHSNNNEHNRLENKVNNDYCSHMQTTITSNKLGEWVQHDSPQKKGNLKNEKYGRMVGRHLFPCFYFSNAFSSSLFKFVKTKRASSIRPAFSRALSKSLNFDKWKIFRKRDCIYLLSIYLFSQKLCKLRFFLVYFE